MKKLTIFRDKKKYNKKFYDMKIVKYFVTPFEASEYLFRYMPNGRFNGLNVSYDEVVNSVNVLWVGWLDEDILDNNTIKIK